MKFISTWRLERQVIVFAVYFLIVFIPFSIVAYIFFSHNANCFDGIQNQDEESVDCGGKICQLRCDGTYRDLKVSFTRGMKVSDGRYDIFSLVNNFNPDVDFPNVPYDVNVYSFEGKLLGTASGSLSISAKRRGVVFFPNLPIAQDPKTIELNLHPHRGVSTKIFKDPHDLLNVENWQATRGANNSLQIVGDLKNPYNEDIGGVSVYAMLYDDTKSVYAVSKTVVPYIKAKSGEAVTFSWGNILTPQNAEFVVIENE